MKNYYQSQIADTVPQVFSEAEFRRLYNYDKDTKILLTFVHDEEVSFYELAWLVKDIDGAYFCSVFPDFDLPEGKLTYRPAEENNIISRNSNFYNIRKDNIQGIYIEKICFICILLLFITSSHLKHISNIFSYICEFGAEKTKLSSQLTVTYKLSSRLGQ